MVAGGAAGFGEGIVRLYAEHGAKVVVGDFDAPRGEQLAARSATRCISSAATCRAGPTSLVSSTPARRFGTPDIVVNNAGTTHDDRPMLEVDEPTFDRIFAVNVESIFPMAHAVVPLMRQRRKGVVLNVGSTARIRPCPGLSWYNGTKGAVNLLSKSMAVELGPDNIGVNAICPVMGETELFEKFMGMPDTPENRARFLATIPLGRRCRASDVAAAALFLASDAAASISGVEFPVDGARTV